MRNGTVLGLALVLAACAKPAAPSVAGAWVRLPAVPGRPAAGYFMLYGGSADATLIAVRLPAGGRAELHESMANGMRPISSVAVPAGGTVSFAPGGRHAMLFGIDPRLAAGRTLRLELMLADSRILATDAKLVAAADPAP